VLPRATIDMYLKAGKTVTITRLVQRNPRTGKTYAALVMAIDLDLYRSTLEHWDCEEIS